MLSSVYTTNLFLVKFSVRISKDLSSFSVTVHTRPHSIAAPVRCTPPPQPRPRVVTEYDPAARMFAAAQPCTLSRITEEDDSVLRDGSERCRRRGAAPTHRIRFTVEFSYQIRLASAAIDQANIEGTRSRAGENSFGDPPDRATKHLGRTQIFRRNSYFRELERAK